MTLDIQFSEIKQLINSARFQAYRAVNSELVKLHWKVGEQLSNKLKNSEWGDGIIQELANYLKINEPILKGFDKRGLYRMIQFYETYSSLQFTEAILPQLQLLSDKVNSSLNKNNQNTDNQNNIIVSTLSTQFDNKHQYLQILLENVLSKISWSHHMEILVSCKNSDEKMFYLLMTQKEKWSVRDIRRNIKTSTFERTMVANKQINAIQDKIPQNITNIFKDSYVLDFLELPELHTEQNLKKKLIRNLASFMKELGNDFLFIQEEFKLKVGAQDFYIDLLFYHLDLQCLVACELKTEKFMPQDLGQINFYLEALDRDIKKTNENPSIGILLCKSKDDLVVEYALSRSMNPAMIANYQTKLPDKQFLHDKWQEIIELSLNSN